MSCQISSIAEITVPPWSRQRKHDLTFPLLPVRASVGTDLVLSLSLAARNVPSKSTSALKANVCVPTHCDCTYHTREKKQGRGEKGMRRKGQAAVTTRRDTARREACVSRKKWFHHTHAHEERPAASCFQTISTDLRPRSHTASAPTVYATRPLRSTKP